MSRTGAKPVIPGIAMDLQFVIALNVMSIAALFVVMGFASWRPENTSWIVANAIVVAVGFACLTFAPGLSGWVTTLLFVPFVIVPNILARLAVRADIMSKTSNAQRYMQIASLLHPSPSMRFHAGLYRGLKALDDGDGGAELSALAAKSTGRQRLLANLLMNARLGRWEEVARLCDASEPLTADTVAFRVRSCGELGRVEDLLRAYRAGKDSLSGIAVPLTQAMALAFGGRVKAVEQILSGRLAKMNPELKTYWHAVAKLAAGQDVEAAKASLSQLAASSARVGTRLAAGRLVARPETIALPQLSTSARYTLDDIERAIPQPNEPAIRTNLLIGQFPVTIALLVANFVMYGIELMTDALEQNSALLALGAAQPRLILDEGEWWRLLAAAFLHGGFLHITLNMLNLYILGRILEPMMGSVRFAIAYLVGAVLSSYGSVLVLQYYSEDEVLVGASGAIFALIGLLVAFTLVNFLSTREPIEKQRLTNLVAIALIQFVIGAMVPQIAGSAHMAGFAVGIVTGLLMVSVGRLRTTAWPR